MPFPVLSRVAALSVALAASPGLSSGVAAQSRGAEDTRIIDGYRLTMPTLRKVLPALYHADAATCAQSKDKDPHTLPLAEMTRSLERCGPVMKALKQAGVPARDAAIVFASLLRTGQQVAMQGGRAMALPPGVLRDNALLLEQNDPELRRLSKTQS